jgi:hypothetical protein
MVPKTTPSTQSSHVAVTFPPSNDLRAFAVPNDAMIARVSNLYAVNLTKSGGLGSTWADDLAERLRLGVLCWKQPTYKGDSEKLGSTPSSISNEPLRLGEGERFE